MEKEKSKKRIKKITFLDQEDIPKDSKVLYAFTPFESTDADKNFTFKCGMSFGSFDSRLENYYTSIPFGVIPLQVLILPTTFTRDELKDAEKELFKLLAAPPSLANKNTPAVKRLHSPTRVRKMNQDGGETEWFFGGEDRLEEVFVALYEKYIQITLKSYSFEDKIKQDYAKEKTDPNTWVGETFIPLGKKNEDVDPLPQNTRNAPNPIPIQVEKRKDSSSKNAPNPIPLVIKKKAGRPSKQSKAKPVAEKQIVVPNNKFIDLSFE